MSEIIVAGDDPHDIGAALETAGFDVSQVDIGNRSALEAADVREVDTFILTEVRQATSIAVAKYLNDGLKVIVYADGSLPDFARKQADLLLDPGLFEPDDVAAEL